MLAKSLAKITGIFLLLLAAISVAYISPKLVEETHWLSELLNIKTFTEVEAVTSWTEDCIIGGTPECFGNTVSCTGTCPVSCQISIGTCAVGDPPCPSRTHATYTENCGVDICCDCDGSFCTGTGSCVATGSCSYICDSGWFNDDGNNTNGCENQAPKWNLNSTNNTEANMPTLFSVNWTDTTDSLSGYIFSLDNATGSFVNDSWVSLVTGGAVRPSSYNNWTNGAGALSFDPEKSYDDGVNDTTTYAVVNTSSTADAFLELNFSGISSTDTFVYTWKLENYAPVAQAWVQLYNFTSGSWVKINASAKNSGWATIEYTLTPDFVNNEIVMSKFSAIGLIFSPKMQILVGDVYISQPTTNPTVAWTNVTKVIGSGTVRWKVYVNDTYDRWNITDEWSILTLSTCVCSSIQAGNPIDCGEGCSIGNCDVGNIDVSFKNSGLVTITGNVTNVNITYLSPGCILVRGKNTRWG